jgi:hypothetical protein
MKTLTALTVFLCLAIPARAGEPPAEAAPAAAALAKARQIAAADQALGKFWLRQVIAKYPDTPEAAEAQRLVEEYGGDRVFAYSDLIAKRSPPLPHDWQPERKARPTQPAETAPAPADTGYASGNYGPSGSSGGSGSGSDVAGGYAGGGYGAGGPKTVHVSGYTRRDGTYVRSYYRAAPGQGGGRSGGGRR